MAAQLWRLVFSQEPPAVLERWLAFLESHPEVRGITSDTWNMFLHFAETAGRDLSTYDDSEAWPSLFDDFVEYENDQTNQNVLHQVNKGGSDVKAEVTMHRQRVVTNRKHRAGIRAKAQAPQPPGIPFRQLTSCYTWCAGLVLSKGATARSARNYTYSCPELCSSSTIAFVGCALRCRIAGRWLEIA
ncbi:hypothetical protein MRX96_021872 [Rhipicephalus microplus]